MNKKKEEKEKEERKGRAKADKAIAKLLSISRMVGCIKGH